MADLAAAGRGAITPVPPVIPGGPAGAGAAPRRRFRPISALSNALAAEGERLSLWLSVFFGAGIALYFALTVEPPGWLGIAATAIAAAVAFGLRRRPVLGGLAIVLAFSAAGLAAVQHSRWERGTPMLERRLGSVAITGRIVDIDQLERGWRMVIVPDPIPKIAPAEQPRRVRIRIPPTSDALQPGDRVSLRGRLYPVPAQIIPGTRDLQRSLFFSGIGAVGYSFGAARRIAEPGEARVAGSRVAGWHETLRRLRNEMTRRINAALPGPTGGVASALITGKRRSFERRAFASVFRRL